MINAAILTLLQAEEALRKHNELEIADEIYALACMLGGENNAQKREGLAGDRLCP
jgi:hypothetical protein